MQNPSGEVVHQQSSGRESDQSWEKDAQENWEP